MLERRKRIKKKSLFQSFFSRDLNVPTYLTFLVGLTLGFILYPTVYLPWQASSSEKVPLRVCFSPEGQCTDKIVDAINSAQSSISVAAYAFTCPRIAEALRDAYKRGVDVKLLVDRSQLKEKYSQLPFLLKKGIPVYIDSAEGLAHNKIMLFDNRWVLTGSFNFTRAANSKNAENILLIDDPSLAQIYKKNWESRVERAKRIFE
ncbi:MAG: phospholipase D family protein [Alphaproteobacteria bacterium]|jgi:phospholipase D|nr:phospholipase D family protein [Alphaproteobacteria bacterium]